MLTNRVTYWYKYSAIKLIEYMFKLKQFNITT